MNNSTVEMLADNVSGQVQEKLFAFTAAVNKLSAAREDEFVAILATFEQRLSVLEKQVAKL